MYPVPSSPMPWMRQYTAREDSLYRSPSPVSPQFWSICSRSLPVHVDEKCRVSSPGSWDVVKTIQKRYFNHHSSKPKLKHLNRIAIDEIALAKGHQYMTVVLDLERGVVVFVWNDKGSDALNPLWKRLKTFLAKIQAVAIDISPAYINGVSTHLSDAFIVFDRFHVMTLFNDRLSNFRREIYSQVKDKTWQSALKGIHWLLLKNPENLDDVKNKRERLEEALQINQPLAIVYYMNDLLRAFWNCWNYQEAARFMDSWIAKAETSGIRMLYVMNRILYGNYKQLLTDYPFWQSDCKFK